MNSTKLQRWADEILAKQAPVAPIAIVRGTHPQVWKDLKQAMRSGAIAEAINVRSEPS